MEMLTGFIDWVNGWSWGIGMLIIIGGSGIIFTVALGFFQFVRHGDMWSRIFSGSSSESGISTFASFCTTMAMRIGTGNVAGVATAIYNGGPGALFWMWVIGITNAAVCFVECTAAQLFKTKMDGEYRGAGPYVSERCVPVIGKGYGVLLAIIFGVGAVFFMPAAATYTISDAFFNAAGIPYIATSAILALVFAIIVIGGIKRIGDFASAVVPFMTVVYLLFTIIIFFANIGRVPQMFADIFAAAFNRDSVTWGAIGVVIQQGIKRGTFSSASGMGESMPAAAAAETSHPVKQGLANAAGVFLDTIVVCTCSAFMILLTGCYKTNFGHQGYNAAAVENVDAGVGYVQTACAQVVGAGLANWFIAIMLLLFSFTCIVSYYYEGETALLYLFQGKDKDKIRKGFSWAVKIIMVVLVFLYGFMKNNAMAFNVADAALGSVTWFNMVVVWFAFPAVIKVYKDYCKQMKAGKDPVFNPDDFPEIKGIDRDLWKSINHLK